MDWSSDVCSSDLSALLLLAAGVAVQPGYGAHDGHWLADGGLRLIRPDLHGGSAQPQALRLQIALRQGLVACRRHVEHTVLVQALKGHARADLLGLFDRNVLKEDRKSTRLNSSH